MAGVEVAVVAAAAEDLAEKARRGRMIVARFQGAVGDSLVVDGVLKGIPIPIEALNLHMGSAE